MPLRFRDTSERGVPRTSRTRLPYAVLLSALALPACGGSRDLPPSAATVHPAAADARAASTGDHGTITLTNARRQRFVGFGTAVASDSVIDPLAGVDGLTAQQIERMDTLLLRSGVRLVRVFGPGQMPGAAGVRPWTPDDGRLRMMQRLKRRGVRFMFTGQGAPPALVTGGGENGPLVAGQEEAYARFLAACIAEAARQGTPFDLAAVGNELDNSGDPGVSMSAGQSALVAQALQAQLDRRRLRTRIVLGDNTSWAATAEYAQAQARALPRRASLLASHAYGGDAGRDEVSALASRLRVPLWMTEWVDACPRGDCPDDPSIGKALTWSAQITGDLVSGGAQAWFMFRGMADSTHGADGAILVRDSANQDTPLRRTKRYPVIRQFSAATSPGSALTAVRGAVPDGVLVAGFTSRTRRGVVLTRRGGPVTVRLALGGRAGRLRVWRTDASSDFRAVPARRSTPPTLTLELAQDSITTVTSDVGR